MEEDKSSCYTRILPLKNILNEPVYINKLQDIHYKVNEIIRHTYQFIRLYFIHLYTTDTIFPTLNRSFIKQIFSLISHRNRNKNMSTELQEFFKKHYKEHMLHIEEGKGLKEILDPEITILITSIENHIKNTFYSYINSLVSLYTCGNKKEYNKLKKYLTSDSDEVDDNYVYIDVLDRYKNDILDAKKNIFKNPQSCFSLLFRINEELESNGKKMYSLLPLRRSLIPKYISLSSTIIAEIFRVKSNEENKQSPSTIWSNIKQAVDNEFNYGKKIKHNYSFLSLKTDMVGCSLIFKLSGVRTTGVKKYKKKKTIISETYFDDLSTLEYKQITENKNVVVIDPNKGNLMYCYDGENVIRYTQNQRRKDMKKTKYKKIRREQEIYKVKESRDLLSQHNSKTVDFHSFKEYIKSKNKDREENKVFWRDKIYRKLNFNTKINVKKSEASFLNHFKDVYGSPEKTIVVFGDWEQRKGISFGKEPTKGKGCRKMLREFGYKVYLKDEFRTSKICSKCHSSEGNEYSYAKRKDPRPWKKNCIQSVWGLSRCKNVDCGKIHNRDMNSVSNMYFLSQKMINNQDIPEVFKRGAPS